MSLKPRVLFVDDEERIVNLLRLTFRGTYEVFTATSGAEALAIVRSRPMQVIVSDQRMPGMRWTTCAASRPPRCGCC
jgi:serine/threonine-protein kinase